MNQKDRHLSFSQTFIQLDMIPTLKEEEKAQIYAWLVEAREYAMDAESSKKKHEAFGKYKGRINNYKSSRLSHLQSAGHSKTMTRQPEKQNENDKVLHPLCHGQPVWQLPSLHRSACF